MKSEINLNKKEINWIKNRCIKRLTDGKEVQIYPMGAERHLKYALSGATQNYPIAKDIFQKSILVIPGFGNTGFIFANAGAKLVHVYDKDPVTIAWVKAFKKYYYFREVNYPSIGELLDALTQWYPPLLHLPFNNSLNKLRRLFNPNALRRVYLHYLVHLTQLALSKKNIKCFELDKNLEFYTGTIEQAKASTLKYDTAYVPYLLGVKNGIEQKKEIITFIQMLNQHLPNGKIIITPSRNNKEFFFLGKRYLITDNLVDIIESSALCNLVFNEDTEWFKTQGLCSISTK